MQYIFRMSSLRQQEAAPASGAKSRGPETSKGKLVSSRNAVKLGMLCGTVVLEFESRELFTALLTELLDELKPQTAATRAAVAFRTLSDDSRSLEFTSCYESRHDRQYLRAHHRLLELIDRRTQPPPSEPVAEPVTAPPQPDSSNERPSPVLDTSPHRSKPKNPNPLHPQTSFLPNKPDPQGKFRQALKSVRPQGALEIGPAPLDPPIRALAPQAVGLGAQVRGPDRMSSVGLPTVFIGRPALFFKVSDDDRPPRRAPVKTIFASKMIFEAWECFGEYPSGTAHRAVLPRKC
jgi:hypothetical protein